MATKGELSANEKDLIEFIGKGAYSDVKRCLQEKDVRVDCLDSNGMTPLQHAAYKANVDIAKLLLANGAQVNNNNHEHGYTALMFAAISGSAATTKLMLEAGGNPNHVNSVGRTAAQMAGFVGQSDCASLINNFFSKADLEYYTVIRGHEKDPKLNKNLVEPLYTMVLHNNLHPVFLSMYIEDHPSLLDESYRVSQVLDLLCEKMMKQSDTNEVMAVKFHYLACIIRQSEKARQNNKQWIKFLVRGRDSDGFPENQEQFIRGALKEFPYIDSQLLRQMVQNISPVKIGESPTALSILLSAINGQKFATDDDVCATCGSLKEDKKKCSACNMVRYCNQKCQKLHWPTHKKFCKQLAEQHRMEEELKKLEAEKEKAEKEKAEKEKAEKEKAEAEKETEPVVSETDAALSEQLQETHVNGQAIET